MSELAEWLRGFVSDKAFLARYPYYASILSKLDPVADVSVPVMGVSLHDARFYLHINVDYFTRRPDFLRGVLLHEIHHLVLGHLAHPKFQDASSPDLMDIAKEISANEHIEEPLPPAITLRDYERYGLAAGQSTLERYERLLTLRQDGKLPPKLELRMVDTHLPAPTDPGAIDHVRRLVEDAIDEAEARDPHLQEQNARVCGKRPRQLLESLDRLSPPEVPIDWRTALRMFVARARAPIHTYARPSRRFPGRTGEIPGRIWGSRTEHRHRLLVAIDTSASMTPHDLAQVATQLTLLSEHATLLIAEVDAKVHRVYPFTGKLESVMGRGGTDLRPALDPALLAQHKVEGVVYFTDGQGPLPAQPPPRPVLWVLTGDEDFDCAWGQRTRFTR